MPTTSQKGNTTTTLTPIEVSLSTSEKDAHAINLIDTPGWEFNDPDINLEGERENDEEEDEEEDADMADGLAPAEKWDLLETYVTKDILTRNVGRVDKIKDPYPLGEPTYPV
jgi:nuclear GTP-binding protein